MTADELAAIHRRAFTRNRPWTAQEFADLLAKPYVTLHRASHGFALTQTIAGESELLTIAVDPALQRQGIGRNLLRQVLQETAAQADTIFLEVAADNMAPISLYLSEGFAEIARRKGYYPRDNGRTVDALILRRDLTRSHDSVSTRSPSESG